ncbi:MAG: hypothetical protein EXS36_17755 [Pedosphaera sp.]|nr:hypothetical protein [Pedosphaera sp.]
MALTPESKLARSQLAAAGRKRDQTTRFATALTIGAAMALLFVQAALVDYWVLLPVGVRWLAALLATGTVKWFQLGRRPTSLKQAALGLEVAQPQIGCEVSTAAEYLNGDRKVTQDYEQDLVLALEKKTTTTLKRTSVPYERQLFVPALATGIGLLALLAFATTVPSAGAALKRTVAPGSSAAFTQVKVSPGSIEVPIGRDLDLTSIFSGRIPSKAELRLRQKGTIEWTVVPLRQATNGTYLHTLKNVHASFSYRVSGSDAVSDNFAVTAYVPPEVKELRVHLDPPAYTRLKSTLQASADVHVVRGSTATFHLIPTVPLSKARLHFTNDAELELTLDVQQQWTVQLPILKDDGYRIELFDTKGRRSADDQVHYFTAIPDAPPKVEITEPGGDMRAAAVDKIPLKISATDDFCVAELKVVYHRLNGPEQEAVVHRTSVTDTDVKGEFDLDLAGLKLNEFELIAYHAVATDNNTLDSPGVGRSPVYFVEITNLEGKPCKKPGKPGKKMNLLMVEKQIIADTTALAKNASADKFAELAARQMDAVAFAQMYQNALTQSGAPLPLQGEINVAVNAMKQAGATLEKRLREGSLPPEEAALASLYRVMQLMPKLQDLPIVPPAPEKPPGEEPPPALKVVLEAILKRNLEDPNQAEFARALDQIQELSCQQSRLSAACQNSGENPNASPDASLAAISRPAAAPALANNAATPKSSGQGKGGQPGDKPGDKASQARADASKGLVGENKKPEDASAKPNEQALAKLGPQQEQLSKEAQEIADRLARLAGKASRLGVGAAKQMGEASGKMAVAAKAMKGGDRAAAGSASDQSSAAMGSAMSLLENLLTASTDEPLTGVVLFSDGIETSTRSLEGVARQFHRRGIPIHAVVTGTTNDMKDVVIENVQVKRAVPNQAPTRVVVALRSAGYPNQTVPIQIRRDGDVLAVKEVRLNGAAQQVELDFTPRQKGIQMYEVRIAPLEEEWLTSNNRRQFALEVLDPTVHVIYMEGTPQQKSSPFPEWKYLRDALHSDKDIKVTALYRQKGNNGQFLNTVDSDPDTHERIYPVEHPTHGFPNTLAALLEFDVIIHSDIKIESFSPEQLQNIDKLVEQHGAGFVMIGGNSAFGKGGYHRTILDRIIPVAMESSDDAEVRPIHLTVPRQAWNHPLVAFGGDRSETQVIWTTKFPTLYGMNRVERAKPGAVVLAEAEGPGGNVLIAVQQIGKGRSLAFTSDTTRAWGRDFETIWGEPTPSNGRISEANNDCRYYRQFWVNAVRWLAAGKIGRTNSAVTLELAHGYCGPGDVVKANVHVRNNQLQELATADVTLSLGNGLGRSTNALVSARYDSASRLYVAELRPPVAGSYIVTAAATQRGVKLGDDRQLLVSEVTDKEMEDLRARPDLMAAIAGTSGGRTFSTASALPNVQELLANAPPPTVEHRRTPLWDKSWWLGTVLELLTLEWAVRRWRGLA